jgi:hypothetical protein
MINDNHSVHTNEALVEAYIFPVALAPVERQTVDAEIRTLRLQRLRTMSDGQKLQSDLLRFKFQIEDALQQDVYLETSNFASFLELYLKILGKKQVEFAHEISLHPTKLSQLLKNKARPNLMLVYRLEKHSGGLISALLWWKLVAQKTEADILNDTRNRAIAAQKVLFQVTF